MVRVAGSHDGHRGGGEFAGADSFPGQQPPVLETHAAFFLELKSFSNIMFGHFFFLTVGALLFVCMFCPFSPPSLVEIRSASQSCCAKPVDWEAKFKLK